MAVQAAAAGMGAKLVEWIKVRLTTEGEGAIDKLIGGLSSLNSKLLNLGVTAIFLDRLLFALQRAWNGFNEALGATRTAEEALELRHMADMLEMSTDKLQGLTAATAQYGAELPDVVDLLTKVQEKIVKLGESTSPNSDVAQAFKGTGLTAASFEGKDVMTRLLMISDGLKRLPRERALRSIKGLFEDELTKLFGPFLLQGSAGISAAVAEVERLGAVMSPAQVNNAVMLGQALAKLQAVFKGLRNNVASAFIPMVKVLTDLLTVLIGRLSAFVKARYEIWAHRIAEGVKAVLAPLIALGRWWDTNVMSMEESIVRFGHGLLTLMGIIALSMNALFLGKMAMVISYMALLALYVEDWLTWMRGGESTFDDMLGDSAVLQWFVWLFGVLYELVKAIAGEMRLFMEETLFSTSGIVWLTTIIALVLVLGGALWLTFRVFRYISALINFQFEGFARMLQFLIGMLEVVLGLLGAVTSIFFAPQFGKYFEDMMASGFGNMKGGAVGGWTAFADIFRSSGRGTNFFSEMMGPTLTDGTGMLRAKGDTINYFNFTTPDSVSTFESVYNLQALNE